MTQVAGIVGTRDTESKKAREGTEMLPVRVVDDATTTIGEDNKKGAEMMIGGRDEEKRDL